MSVSSDDRSGEDEFHNIVEKNNNERNISIQIFTDFQRIHEIK